MSDIKPMSVLEIWDWLTPEERRTVYNHLLDSKTEEASDLRKGLSTRLAGFIRFRPESFLRSEPAWQVQILDRYRTKGPIPSYLHNLLQLYLTEARHDLLEAFLKAADVPARPEDPAFIAQDYDGPIPAENLKRAFEAVRSRFFLRDIRLYLEFAWSIDRLLRNIWSNLPVILEPLRQQTLTPKPAEPPTLQQPQETAAIPDIPQGLTVLDRIFIDVVVASANGIIGSQTPQELEAVLTEFDSLSHHRHQSRYHLGFFDALFDRPFAAEQKGDNHNRRAWYLAGFVTGLARRNEAKHQELVRTVKEHIDILRAVASKDIPCGPILLRHTYRPLIDLNELPLLSGLIHRHLLSVSDEWNAIQAFAEELLAAASDLIRNDKPKESLAILEPLLEKTRPVTRRLAEMSDAYAILQNLPEPLGAGLERRILRKIANAYQSLGQFEKAEETLREVVSLDPSSEEAAAARADLGLIRGGFRSLFDVLPDSKPESAQTIHDALERGLPEFREAAQAGRGSQNAHICLGIHAVFGGSSQAAEAARHFELALAGMAGNPGYEVRNLNGWVRFLHGLSLLETTDVTYLHKAQESLRIAMTSAQDFPFFLWKRCLTAASAFDDPSLAVSLAETLLQTQRHRHAALKFIAKEPNILRASAEIRRAFLDHLTQGQLTDEDRWRGFELLLDTSRKAEDLETASQTLDAMEAFAFRHHAFAEPLLAILRDRNRYQPAWDSEDAENTVVNLLEFLNRNAEAVELLKIRFYTLLNTGKPWDLEEAEELAATIRDLGADEETHITLLKAVESRKPSIPAADTDPAEQRLRKGERVTLAFVGGNETQAQYENDIKRELLKDYPGLDIRFIFSAYDSNWGLYYDKVRTLKPQLDGIIISRWARTELGRKLRPLCDNGCIRFDSYTKGKRSIQETIRRAAITVVTQRLRKNAS